VQNTFDICQLSRETNVISVFKQSDIGIYVMKILIHDGKFWNLQVAKNYSFTPSSFLIVSLAYKKRKPSFTPPCFHLIHYLFSIWAAALRSTP
jgi:hypothetical protein